MVRRILIFFAMAGIYVWIRRHQAADPTSRKADHAAESEWANEGGANPAPTV